MDNQPQERRRSQRRARIEARQRQQAQQQQPNSNDSQQNQVEIIQSNNSQPLPQVREMEEEKYGEMQLEKQQPIQRQQFNHQVQFPHEQERSMQMKIAPTKFISKIPNRKVLRDFFENECKFYCPPLRDMNKEFITKVLKEEKFLLPQKMVQRVTQAPNFKDFSTSRIWGSVQNMQNKEKVLKYFPQYPPKVLPNKQYLIDVINTLDPGLILQTVKDLKKKKLEKEVAESPVHISKFFMDKLNNFESISNDEHKTGIGNILLREYPQCNICLMDMKNYQPKRKYRCNIHQGHAGCVINYYQSQQNLKYLCPLRCNNPNQVQQNAE